MSKKFSPEALKKHLEENTRSHMAHTAAPARDGARLVELSVDALVPSPYQGRLVFDEAAMGELAKSIQDDTLIQPVLARPLPSGKYEIVAGERRWRAHKMVNLRTVPCLVRDLEDREAAHMVLAENTKRSNLCDYERAKSIPLYEPFYPTREALAEAFGMARQDFYKLFDFARLPDFVIEALDESPGLITRNVAAKLLLAIKSVPDDGLDAAMAELKDAVDRLKAGKIAYTALPGVVRKSGAVVRAVAAPIVREGKTVGTTAVGKKRFKIEVDVKLFPEEKQQRLIDFLEELLDAK